MNRFFKTAVLSLAVAATTLTTLPAANAGDRNWRRHHYNGGQDRYQSNNNDLAIAGILGLAAGALIVGLSSQRNPEPAYNGYYRSSEPVYDNYYRKPRPRPVRDYPATANYQGGAEPWTRGWYEYCSNRYRSFNPDSGTYRGYDGRDHFCYAN